MKVAIHHNGNDYFSPEWIKYCKRENIEFKIVNAYANNIMDQLKEYDVFLWHFSNYIHSDMLFGKQLLYSVSNMGVKVFPDFNTCWHFDDKVGQKYLLEGINAPIVNSYVFYDEATSLKWISETTFPKVFKLKGGAGSSNVRLVNCQREAKKLVRKAFSKGFVQYDRFEALKRRILGVRSGSETNLGLIKGLVRFVIGSPYTKYSRMHGRDKGYVYFQDFIPNNKFDIRVVVTGNKAFAIKRMTLNGDFRASGSGLIKYDKNEIDERCVKIAFDINEKLNTQSITYDFVFTDNGVPLIVEISYGYYSPAYRKCPGYWDKKLNWVDAPVTPEFWQLEDIMQKFSR
jgi:glutathione synthase/RimK-type ligase-like ATP-grasp enzyme